MATDLLARAGSVLDIDLGAICANWRLLAQCAAPAQCAAVVKANAYGLGLAPVAQTLAAGGCRMFFVALLDEAIALREALGAGPEIAVLNGPPAGTGPEFLAHCLIPVLNAPSQIDEWTRVSISRSTLTDGEGACRTTAILHIDTGMARLGLSPQQFARLTESPPPIGWRAVMSHLACADTPEHPLNKAQQSRFAALAAQLPGVPASLAASSGIFLGPQYHFDLVRPGAALYGVNPQPGHPNPLRQIVRLSAKILQIRQIDRGESVGYGAAHVMTAPGRIAVAAIGYGDGWPRALSGRGCGYLAGMRLPLLGRVSMDLVAFDASAVPENLAHPGAMIELLGPHYGLDDAARDAGTIGYEILCTLGARYHRVYHAADGANQPE